MMLEEVKQFLDSEEGKSEEVSNALSSYFPITKEKVQEYADTVPDGKAWLDSVKDLRHGRQIIWRQLLPMR